jgi:hypothetical protein
MSWQIRCRIVIVAIVVVFVIAVQHLAAQLPSENWASSQALGDVIVSFNGAVTVYRNADGMQKGADIPVEGTNRGIAFDGSLTLFVTNTTTTPAHQVVKLSPNDPHGPTGTQGTQANPQSIVFAGDGAYYVASRASTTQALIRRFTAAATACAGSPVTGSNGTQCDFTVTVASSGTCVGIDLDANQTILYIVDGATSSRLIRTLDVSTNTTGPSYTLTGNQGSACGIRALPPERHSWTSLTSGPTNGGFLVADKDRIQRVSSTGAFVAEYKNGANSPTAHNWLDVELDPNTFDFWALDAGELLAARFTIAAPSTTAPQTISTSPDVPRGLTLNGALRAAQTIRLLTNIPANSAIPAKAKFLEDTPASLLFQHEFQIKVPAAASLAVQAVEARSDGDPAGEQPTTPPTMGNEEGICPGSLDIDCRIDEFFQATADDYSRHRAVFYVLTELATFTPPQCGTPPQECPVQIGVLFAGSNPGSGAACVPDGTTQTAFALLRDPFPHIDTSVASGYSVFPQDITVLVFSDEVSTVGRTRNHYVVVNRADALYNAQMVKPALNNNQQIITQQLGSTLQVAVVVSDPDPVANCSLVPGLNSTLVLSVANLTTRTLIADSAGVSGSSVITSGLEFVSTAGQYRANITLSAPTFVVGNEYRVCVNAKVNAGFLTDPNDRAIGEVCQQFTVVAGTGKNK